MNRMKIFWTIVAIAVIDYAVMVFWSLPNIANQAGGLMPFDVRPTGYSFEEAKAFVSALSIKGNIFYLSMQHMLDTVFPIMQGVAVGWAIFMLAPKSWGGMRWLAIIPAVAGMVFDLLENRQVGVMLTTGAKDLTAEVVSLGSMFTIAKSVFVTIAMITMLGLLVRRYLEKRKAA